MRPKRTPKFEHIEMKIKRRSNVGIQPSDVSPPLEHSSTRQLIETLVVEVDITLALGGHNNKYVCIDGDELNERGFSVFLFRREVRCVF